MAVLHQRARAHDRVRLERQGAHFDYQAGDVGYVPFAMGHYVENTGDETLRFLELFRSPYFADVSLNQWMGLTPPELVQLHLNLDQQTMAALRKDKPVIVGPQLDAF
jgi:oxalate decarboxylase